MLEERGKHLYRALRLVRPLTLDSARVVEAAMRERGLTVGMRAVTEVLAEDGPATVPEIARTLNLARQGVQRLVNELAEHGHTESRPNPRHRRSVLIALTPAGAAAFAAIRAEESRHLGAMAASCSDEEIETAVKVLSALSADVRSRARQADDRTGEVP